MPERIGVTRNGDVAFSIDLPDDCQGFEFVVRKHNETERISFQLTPEGALQISAERIAGGGAGALPFGWTTGGGGGGALGTNSMPGGAGGGFPVDRSSIKYE
ncbi:hypothetical protein [Burkholderia sp. EMB26]|uniref:hypothetical protein n=1 Tax=Burkholderia sp. EMB26 TaxID=2854261 RepID=UPI00215AB19A|nr:hypothetical protein [Burkholderia sp. EMB26]UVE57611.1 hypothetical protein KU887_19685 [Burkholderia sp. EMB26]